MEFADGPGESPVTETVLTKVGVDEDTGKQLEHGLYMVLKKFTVGQSNDVIQRGIHNGIDAWRNLSRDHELPLADDKRNILVTECMKLKEPGNAGGLKHIIAEIDRISCNWERLANRPFDEETKVGKLRGLIPAATRNCIAQGARSARPYMELVSIVMNQLTDPQTAMLLGNAPSHQRPHTDPFTSCPGLWCCPSVCLSFVCASSHHHHGTTACDRCWRRHHGLLCRLGDGRVSAADCAFPATSVASGHVGMGFRCALQRRASISLSLASSKLMIYIANRVAKSDAMTCAPKVVDPSLRKYHQTMPSAPASHCHWPRVSGTSSSCAGSTRSS